MSERLSPRYEFLQTPFAKEIGDALITDKWRMTLTMALAETVVNYPLNSEGLEGIKLFISELLRIAEKIEEPPLYQAPQLIHDLERSQLRNKKT